MFKLNHINLTVNDAVGCAEFFERCFAFRVTDRQGNGKFAVLEGQDGFILILMYGKNGQHTTYPPLFHVGFVVADEDAVRSAYQQIKNAGHEPPIPQVLERGGDPTFGFYQKAPGGITVEVSTPAVTAIR
jgi:catechol 2,3-dioxygenase-like lactoylglutathione lyase family enzyme